MLDSYEEEREMRSLSIEELKDEVVVRARDVLEYLPELVQVMGDTAEVVGPVEALDQAVEDLDQRVSYEREIEERGEVP